MINAFYINADLDENPPPDELPAAGAEISYSRTALQLDVPIKEIRACRTAKEAMRLARAASGLDDSEIYQDIQINQGYFSKICSGEATFKPEKEVAFCERVKNIVYPEWRASLHGYTMVKIEDADKFVEVQRQLQEALKENARMKDNLSLLTTLIGKKLELA